MADRVNSWSPLRCYSSWPTAFSPR